MTGRARLQWALEPADAFSLAVIALTRLVGNHRADSQSFEY
jgi:hypothetical protein